MAQIKEIFTRIWAYICMLFAGLGKWFEELELLNIQKIFYILSILVLICGLFRLISDKRKGKKENLPKTQAKKTIDLATDPVKAAEQILKTADELNARGKNVFMKIKNFFKQLWANKITILDIIVETAAVFGLMYFTYGKEICCNEWFKNNYWLGFGIVMAVAAVFDGFLIFGTINKYGWEKLAEYTKRIKAAREAITKGLTKEQRKEIKGKLEILNEGYIKVKNEILEKEEKAKNLLVLIETGVGTFNDQKEYDKVATEITQGKNLLANYENKIKEIKDQL